MSRISIALARAVLSSLSGPARLMAESSYAPARHRTPATARQALLTSTNQDGRAQGGLPALLLSAPSRLSSPARTASPQDPAARLPSQGLQASHCPASVSAIGAFPVSQLVSHGCLSSGRTSGKSYSECSSSTACSRAAGHGLRGQAHVRVLQHDGLGEVPQDIGHRSRYCR